MQSAVEERKESMKDLQMKTKIGQKEVQQKKRKFIKRASKKINKKEMYRTHEQLTVNH